MTRRWIDYFTYWMIVSMTQQRKFWRRFRTKRRSAIFTSVFVTVLILYILDNDGSLLSIPHQYLSDTEGPYVQRFHHRSFRPSANGTKVILVWSKCFGSFKWVEKIDKYLNKNCLNRCIVTKNRLDFDKADAVLFHFTDEDLRWDDIPTHRYWHQVWALYINEPNTYIQESFSQWRDFFNWTISYRKHSSVFTPYGHAVDKSHLQQHGGENDEKEIKPVTERDKIAYAIVSRCADAAKRYVLIDEIRKYIPVDLYGVCGNLSCESMINTCLSEETVSRYKFRLAFEDSHCRDYVTEKYWDTLQSNVIPIVDWKLHQRSPAVIPHSFINVNDFKTIEELIRYMIKVGNDDSLFKSYFTWRKHFVLFTSFWDSFCNFCDALYDTTRPAQVYRDLEGWLRDDTCERFTYLRLYRRYLDRFLFDGNVDDLLPIKKRKVSTSSKKTGK